MSLPTVIGDAINRPVQNCVDLITALERLVEAMVAVRANDDCAEHAAIAAYLRTCLDYARKRQAHFLSKGSFAQEVVGTMLGKPARPRALKAKRK